VVGIVLVAVAEVATASSPRAQQRGADPDLLPEWSD
jgi:hypothetical protein